jgi:predicted acetyltransferase
MKQPLIDLLKTSFANSDDFIRLYFDRVYKEEHTLTLRENGRVISALQMLPYEMKYCGTTVPMAYVCYVCTLPSERGKGRMSQLMQQALDVMRDRKYALTTLIPASGWLFDYYERFGYARAFDYSLETHHRSTAAEHGTASCRIVSQNDLSPDVLYAYFDRKQRERACAVLHTAYDWQTILQDCLLDGGGVSVVLRDGKPSGMAVAVPKDDYTVYIKEIFYDQPCIKEALVQFILTRFHRQTAEVRVPPVPSAARSYGMAQILDKQRMTALYLSYHPRPDTSFLKETDNRMLTQILLQYEQRLGWMNLMLD